MCLIKVTNVVRNLWTKMGKTNLGFESRPRHNSLNAILHVAVFCDKSH